MKSLTLKIAEATAAFLLFLSFFIGTVCGQITPGYSSTPSDEWIMLLIIVVLAIAVVVLIAVLIRRSRSQNRHVAKAT